MGGVTWYLARLGARRCLWSGLGLVILLGLVAGVVMAAWAGARRTESAYDRLARSVAHADLLVGSEGDPTAFDPATATAGPGVVRSAVVHGYPFAELRPDGLLDLASTNTLIVPADDVGFRELDSPRLLEGRAPDPSSPDEIVVPEPMGSAGYPLGHTFDACLVDLGEAFEFGEGVLEGTATDAAVRRFVDEVCRVQTLEVVGITAPGPDEVVLREDTEADSFPVGSPALVSARPGLEYFSFVLVDLADDAHEGPYVDAVLDRTDPAAGVGFTSAALRASVVGRTLEPNVRSLMLFAAALALAGLAVLAPAIFRWAATPEGDRAALRAMGLPQHQLRVASMLRGAALGALAAMVAAVVALVASDRFPQDIAAAMEPYPGRRADVLVLLVGSLSLLLVPAILGGGAATGERSRTARPSRLARALHELGARPPALVGFRSALTGDGRSAGVARTAVGVGAAVGAVVAALTYQASLDQMLEDPVRYGWTWDEVVDVGDSEITPEVVDALAAAPEIEGLASGSRSLLLLDGEAIQLFAFERVRGSTYPTILDGRAPQGDREIALGGQTLDRLGLAIGDTARFRGPQGQPLTLDVVGQTVLPLLSYNADLSIGEGGLVQPGLVESFGVNQLGPLLVDVAPGAPDGTVQALIDAAGASEFGGLGTDGPQLTADLRGYRGVRATPAVLAGVLALLGLAVLAHAVAASVRRRRRELAILRSIGFSRRDLRASVTWSVMVLVLTSLVVALPTGVAVGRGTWRVFARGLGVDSEPVTPVIAVVVVAAGASLAAAAVSLPAARRAARTRPADALRTE